MTRRMLCRITAFVTSASSSMLKARATQSSSCFLKFGTAIALPRVRLPSRGVLSGRAAGRGQHRAQPSEFHPPHLRSEAPGAFQEI